MQVDKATVARYERDAPELLEAVTSGEAEHIMRRDAETDYCVKFDKGWCGIHASKGTEFLGDACHSFPRVTRQLGPDITVQTASLSCPEVTRLALAANADQSWQQAPIERLPHSLRQYAPEAVEPDQAWQIHQEFLAATQDEAADAPRIVARLHAVCESLALVDQATWPMAVPFYLKTADTRLTQPEAATVDAFHLFHALYGLVNAAPPSSRPRLEAVLETIRQALDVQVEGASATLQQGAESFKQLQAMQEAWRFSQAQWQPFLKRWLYAQLSIALFPFAGLGASLSDRMVIIGVRLATLQLALQAHLLVQGTLTEDDALRITQSLARFMDHLADPTLSMQIYTETGWIKRERLWGLLVS